VLGRLVLSAAAIGCNWLMYLVAIETHQVLAASLGYYINPLLNVLIGVVFLNERSTACNGRPWRWPPVALPC
jgi:chloramphenicol-sensitive protein RarD